MSSNVSLGFWLNTNGRLLREVEFFLFQMHLSGFRSDHVSVYFVFFLGVCDWQVIDSLLSGLITVLVKGRKT